MAGAVPTEPVLPTQDVRSELSGEYLRLARLWQRKQGLSWIFAAVDSSDLRDELMDRLDSRHTDVRVLLPAMTDPVQLVAQLENASAHAARAHLLLAPGWQPDAPWWQRINTLRERLADAFPKPLIWWLPDDCVTLAARNAPDFWNWRETVLNFSLPLPPVQVSLPSEPFSYVTSTEKEAIRQRLKDIEDYLASHDRSSAEAAHLFLEAAYANDRLGLWDASLTCAEQAERCFSALGNERMAAQAKGQMADIWQARSKIDEALALLQNDVLPVFTQLGDIRSVALTKGRIASILQARGKLVEALAIRQNDQLPVYEQLSDVRSVAITKGRIADILRLLRKFEEALKLLQNGVLPVFMQLGDIRSVAVTKGKIADILQARGKLDEALAIRENDQLPVYEQIGDIRSVALTKGRISDILKAYGKLGEGLALLRNDVLPVFSRLGDIRSVAVTKGKIAGILQACGKPDEALALLRDQVLPIYETAGYEREAGIARQRIAALEKAIRQNARAT